MSNATTIDTKTQILDVAEHLIAERGFSATTLRNIVSEANVNLAAVHYHFGSKEELFRAVVHRIATPIIKRQLEMLNRLQAETDALSVEDILTAFLTPPFELVAGDERNGMLRARFMGRCRSEPEPVQSIANEEFSSSLEPFLDILQRVLPEQSRSQLMWKMDLVVASLIRVQIKADTPNALLKSGKPQDIQATISKLVTFLAGGMRM
ncbi:MAG: TetR/AcrR family transcriptional regulator [Cyanobacteria bacterium J06638_22]